MSDLSTEIETLASYLSDSAEELEELLEDRVRPKNENYFNQTIPQYNAQEFLEHFRISRHVANSIAEEFQNSDYYKRHAGCYGKLSALNQTYIFLWFVGHQTASFRDVADRFSITISSLFRVIQRVSYFLSNLSPQIIKWPTLEEKNEIESHFRQNGFPGVLGVIDGTHIKIDKPSDDPDSYINRKGFYSIQVQLLCDHQLKIRDVFIGYPGSVHDSRVFRSSPLCQSLLEKCHDLYILGDSGYPLLPNLLTPFKDRGQLTRAQSNYNVKLSKNRYLIEHCIGLLKQKFRQLFHVKLRSIISIAHLIRACCVLHNMALMDDFHYEENENQIERVFPVLNMDENDPDEEPEDRNGIHIRNRVVNILRQ
ncbi:hypothetical protein NQ314_020116 [Rhamnusium bicolor]|uniref:Putative nuclease HARBI1 n=1 Tax=Rhamnusium bicolor TaxID=1586634 RepID=A0AAV8WP03_9CUCU|nr:hypothetical protein NQ314_020116 [Rhamnusium bicolor]